MDLGLFRLIRLDELRGAARRIPMDVTEVRDMIRRQAGGTIFQVHFRKRTTGEERTMLCRLGVQKGIKGKGATYNALEKGLLTVYDMQKDGWRTIPLDQVIWIQIRGQLYDVNAEVKTNEHQS